MSQHLDHRKWWVLCFKLKPEAEELASSVLWDEGTIGLSSSVDSDAVTLTAYFNEKPHRGALQSKIESFLAAAQIPRDALIGIEESELIDQDWLHKWKEGYHAFRVGDLFMITPSWEKPDNPEGRIVIEIDPGMAFGTGTHATTQLCLSAIQQYWEGGSFLDVGTGTGILAMAAANMYPAARVVGVDLDPVAIEVARENVQQNNLTERVELLVGGIQIVPGQPFDMVVANLTADVIENHLFQLTELLSVDGALVLSGILLEQEAGIREQVEEVGLCLVGRLSQDEWVALVCFRASS